MMDNSASDDITEEEFDALLDAIEARNSSANNGADPTDGDSAAITQGAAVPAATNAVDTASSGQSDDITEEEFDALLDRLEADKKTAAAPTTPSDDITDEEFDALLDRLNAAKNTASTAATRDLPAQALVVDPGSTGAVVDEYLSELCSEKHAASLIDLDSNVGIAQVADLHGKFIDLAAAGDIRIAAANVEAIDTAVIQLMYTVISDAAANGRTVVWSDPSPAFRQSVELLGMTQHLQLPPVDSQAA